MEYIIESTVDPFLTECSKNFQKTTGSPLTKIILVLTTPVETKHGLIVESDHQEYHNFFINNVLR